MKISVAVTYLILASTCTSVTAAGKSDPLCKPLRAFVASVGPNDSHEIAFHTSWGSNFKNAKEPAIFAKQCLSRDYGPALPLCQSLMEHGVVEFSNTNAERAISCLAPDFHWGNHVSLEQGAVSLRYGTDNRGSHVTVSYGEDSAMGSMVLRIAVEGY